MAKKIVSLLCALAMLATMIVVSTVSASAAQITDNLLSGDNIGKWTVTRAGSGGVNFSGAVNMTTYSGWTTKYTADDDITGMLLVHLYNSPGSDALRKVTFTYGEALELGDEFEVFMTPYSRARKYGGSAPSRDSYVGLQLGDYTFNFTRVTTEYGAEGNYGYYCLIVSKNGTEIGRTAVTHSQTAALFNGEAFMTRYANDLTVTTSDYVQSGGTNYAGANSHWRTQCLSVAGSAAGGMRGLACTADTVDNGSFRDYTIVVSGGKLSVENVNGDALTFSTNSGDVTAFDVSSGEFASVTPVVTLQGDNLSADKNPMGMVRLTATYNTAGPVAEVVHLNANGGTVESSSLELVDGKLPALPTPTRALYDFNGWFTAAEGGTEVHAGDAWTDGETIYAQWTYNPPAFTLLQENITRNSADTNAGYLASNGYFTGTNFFSTGFYSWALNDRATADLGTYNMSEFNIDFILWGKQSGGDNDYQYVWTFGDLVITFSSKDWTNAKEVAVTYKGNAIAMSSSTLADNAQYLYKADVVNNMEGTANDLLTGNATDELIGAVGGRGFTGGNGIDNAHYVRVAYADGTLTISTPYVRGNGVNGTAPGVVWTSTGSQEMSFLNANVSCALVSNRTSGNEKPLMVVSNIGGSYVEAAVSTLLQPVGATLAVDTDETKSTAIEVYYDKAEIDAAAAAPFVRASVDGTDTDLAALDTTTISGTDYYVAIFTNITPNYFGTDVTFTVGDGTTLVGDPFTYSVKQYCQNKLADSTSSAALKTVCTDILIYGEAVRAYVGAPDASITDGVDLSAATTSHANGAGMEASGDGAYTFVGFSLTMRENIFLTALANYADGLENCTLACRVDGGDNYYLSAGAAVNVSDLDMWYEYRIPVGITQAYNDCTVCLINADGDTVSKTVTLSMADIARYYELNGASDAEKNLGTAILNYATSIAAL